MIRFLRSFIVYSVVFTSPVAALVPADVLAPNSTALQVRQLADSYAGGVGVLADQNLALELYQQAAEMGDAEAAFSAGYRLMVGVSTTADEGKAIKLFEFAAEKQHPAALLWVGLSHQQSGQLKTAERLFKQTADLNVAGALDLWAETLLQLPVTSLTLSKMHGVLGGQSGVSEDIVKQISARDYLDVLGTEDAKFLQHQLTGMGFDTQGIDGDIGTNSKNALSAFRQEKGRKKSAVLTIVDMKDLGFF